VLARADWEPELGPVLIPDRKIVRH
jgi:hypothetical protein